MPERDPDLELVRDLGGENADRQRRALGLLYERYSRRILNVAYRVLGDWDAAQDVTQEVFLDLSRRIATFRGDAGLTSWLYRITVNRAIDVRRREKRRPAWRMGDTVLDEGVRRPRGEDASVDPQIGAQQHALAVEVEAALELLSPKLRAILVLRYLEGLSYEELSEVLACSMGTVKSRLNRAHAAMREAMGGASAAEGPSIR